MTEHEWQACADPAPMLEGFHDRASMRKLRLFAVACCRRIERHWPSDSAAPRLLEVCERHAEGHASVRELGELRGVVGAVGGLTRAERYALQALQATTQRVLSLNVLLSVVHNAARAVREAENDRAVVRQALPGKEIEAARGAFRAAEEAQARERQAQADLLRCLLGNPFREPVRDIALTAPQVVLTAYSTYTGRTYDRLGVVGKVLVESGCLYPEILAHCLEPGLHARGCWALDLILGKE